MENPDNGVLLRNKKKNLETKLQTTDTHKNMNKLN